MHVRFMEGHAPRTPGFGPGSSRTIRFRGRVESPDSLIELCQRAVCMATTTDNTPWAGNTGNAEHAAGKQVAPSEVSQQQAAAAPLHREEALVAIARRVATAPAVDILLQDAAALLADAMGMEHYAVAEIASDEQSLRQALTIAPLALGGKPNRYTSQEAHDSQTSLAGYAIAQGRPVFTADLGAETAFVDHLLRRHKILSALAVPLGLQGQMFGALVAASSRSKKLDRRDLLLAETCGHLVASTIGRLRVEEQSARRERLLARLMETVDAPILILDAKGMVIDMNRAARDLTGFDAADVCGRSAAEVFTPPEQKQVWATAWEQLRRGRARVQLSCELITRDCQSQMVQWNWSAARHPDGTVYQIVATAEAADPSPAEGDLELAVDDELSAEQLAEQPAAKSADAAEDSDHLVAARSKRSKRRRPRLLSPLERRRKPRRAYPYLQRLAPVVDDQMPDPKQFVDVECHDISSGGFSFLFPYPFPSDSLVVELGVPPKLTYLMAQVAHVTRTTLGNATYYLIGCNYTGRLRY